MKKHSLTKKDYSAMAKANEDLKAKGVRQQMKRALTEYYKILSKDQEKV